MVNIELSRCWWSLNHPLRIPQNLVRGKWFVPVPKVDLAVWGLVPPPTHVIYYHFVLCGEIGGHLGKWSKQQKSGGNFWFLSPLFAFMDYILHMSFHIRKQGSTLNMPITAIKVTNLFGGHLVRHCFRPKCFIYKTF